MLRKISLSSAAALLLTAQAFADTSSYRIFLGAYAGSTEKLISSATPKLSGVDGISKIITEYRNDKTYVFLNVLGEGESAAKKMLAIVKEKTGIDDAYYLPVRSKSKIKNKEKFTVVLIVKSPTAEEEVKDKKDVTKTTQKVTRTRKFDPSFKTVKIERAKELSEIVGDTKLKK